MAWVEKTAEKFGRSVLKKVPVVNTITSFADDLGGTLNAVGKKLGIGKSEADKRKDRTRYFHERLRKGDFAHVNQTAQVEGALGGKGTRFKGLALEALWVQRQKEAGASLAEIIEALGGTQTATGFSLDSNAPGAKEARGGRLPNLDGTPNDTEAKWNSLRAGSAPVRSTPAPEPGEDADTGTTGTSPRPDRSAPAAPKKKASSPSAPKAPRVPRPKPDCKYGPRDENGHCPKKPPSLKSEFAKLPKAKPPCAYGERLDSGYCPKKPKRSQAATKAQRKLETAAGAAVSKGAQYIYKNLGAAGTFKLLAKASLVGAAGAAAYAATKKLLTLRPKNWDDIMYETAKQVGIARNQVRQDHPEIDWNNPSDPATAAQIAEVMGPLNQYFKERQAMMQSEKAQGSPPRLAFMFDDNSVYSNTYGK